MDAMRRFLFISRREKIRNEIIKQRVGFEGSVTTNIV